MHSTSKHRLHMSLLYVLLAFFTPNVFLLSFLFSVDWSQRNGLYESSVLIWMVQDCCGCDCYSLWIWCNWRSITMFCSRGFLPLTCLAANNQAFYFYQWKLQLISFVMPAAVFFSFALALFRHVHFFSHF